MNIIVTNKYKGLIYGSNVEVLKELDGVFSISSISRNIGSLFYKKLIIDATAIENFPKEDVLRDLVNTFDAARLILFLPPDNPPPKKFLSFLVSINLYNFTDNHEGLVELINKSNTYDDVKDYVIEESEKKYKEVDLGFNKEAMETVNGRVILGFKNVTKDAGSTALVYMLKKTLEEVHKVRVTAVEVDKRDFIFYNNKTLYSITSDRIKEFLSFSSQSEIVLVDLGNDGDPELCSDVIYLVEPSLYRVNELMMGNRTAFSNLKGKKVVLNNCLLNERDISIFAKEANISIYFKLQPLNDRVFNPVLNNLLSKLGLIDEVDDKPKKGLLDLFK